MAGKAMALVFCAFLFLLALAFLLGPSREFSPQENRYLAQAPEFSWQKVRDGGFMSDFEEYVTDQFPARDLWVSFKALCQRLLGQKENNGVYNGAGDYLIGGVTAGGSGPGRKESGRSRGNAPAGRKPAGRPIRDRAGPGREL